ncbi:serum amyloid A-like protein 1-like [Scleropages formosus]|uniref:Serum amyloid A-like protein 1-like n=1 Tax=Scleropages formosus TaxID=113540 RepID=A0A0N8JVB7_SCLFO|nr:serum amyloid A-like protein 1-like [Scleropages formosus]
MEPSCDPVDEDQDRNGASSSPRDLPDSAELDRNPSPPPDRDGDESGEEGDAIGETVYSKHWLFSTLTQLVQRVTEQEVGDQDQADQDKEVELPEEEEEELCKIWDMAMDRDVAVFLQEFKAADILLGVIAKSRNPRLTEICVGILGNMACFPDACLTLSQSDDLGAVLLLLLGDADPPTLLETTRLLVTCLSHADVAPLWLERVRQQTSVLPNLCFIMCSSTNVDLLAKVGELVDKLFDLDEELMKSWIIAQPSETDSENHIYIAPSLLEAIKQLRADTEPSGPGEEAWTLLSELVCEDLCQSDDPPIVLQEQKGLLASTLAVLSILFPYHGQHDGDTEPNLPLVGSLLRVLQYLRDCRQRVWESHANSEVGCAEEEEEDVQLQALKDTAIEFLANILTDMAKVQHMLIALSEEEPKLADVLMDKFPSLKS